MKKTVANGIKWSAGYEYKDGVGEHKTQDNMYDDNVRKLEFKFDTEKLKTQKGFDENSEDVLTRHLLKLSEIENQFQQLTNKFEEINFKLDKLSSRMTKVQADNQVRFQDIENNFSKENTLRIIFSIFSFSLKVGIIIKLSTIFGISKCKNTKQI